MQGNKTEENGGVSGVTIRSISGSAVPYKSLYGSKGGFFCYIGGSIFCACLSVFLLLFCVFQTNVGVRFVLLFCSAGTLTGSVVCPIRAIAIGKNFPSRMQMSALRTGALTNAQIIRVTRTQKRIRSKESRSVFYVVTYTLSYRYTDKNGTEHIDEYRMDAHELNDPHFTEGALLTVAYIGDTSIPVESYLPDTADDKHPCANKAVLYGRPKVRGKLRPIEPDRSALYGRLLLLLTLLILALPGIEWIAAMQNQTALGILYCVLLYTGTSVGVSVIPMGYAVEFFVKAHAAKNEFRRLLRYGTLGYAALDTSYATGKYVSYVYRAADGLRSGSVSARLAEERVSDILVGYLAPPYILTLVVFSDSESMLVYEKH